MTSINTWRIRILDWLYDHRPDHPGQLASIGEFLTEDQRADQNLHMLLRSLLMDMDTEGLIKFSGTMGFLGSAAMILATGMAEVEQRRRNRGNRALRNAAARGAMLRWIYDHPKESDPVVQAAVDQEVMFEGEPFTKEDLAAAARYLDSKKLITGTPVAQIDYLLLATVTDEGIDCIEQFGGDVADYTRRGERAGTQNIVNFHAPVSGNVAFDAETVTQTASTTGMVADEMVQVLRAIVEALPVMGLPEAEAAALQRDAATLQGELALPTPDSGVVATFGRRVLDKVSSSAAGVVGAVLGAYLRFLAAKAGIELP